MRSRSLPPSPADAANAPDEHNNHPIQQQRQFHQQENDDHDNVFISTTSGAPTRKTHAQSKRPSTIDVTLSLVAPQLQEYLAQASHCAQELQDRNQDLESENRKLKELVRQHRSSALDWCSVSKQYQQDRNFMALRLAELELQISNTTTQSNNNNNNNNNMTGDHTQIVGSSSKSSIAGPSKQSDGDICNDSFSSFVSQSISQILDYMAPSNGSKEPKLPPLSKGSYSVGNSTNRDGGETELIPRSALKSSSKSRSCTCGCQEEIKAWKARCDFAENQATLLEMRCEKTNIMMDAYKAKWTQWKETVVREQYQRRMKAAMSPQSARYMSLSSKQSQSQQQQQQQQPQQHQQEQQGPRKKAYSTSDNSRRVRLGTEESNSSQKRQEVTERNTLFNQLITRVPEGSTTARSSTPANRSLRTGTNSISSPHVVFDDKDDNESSSNDDTTEELERRKPVTYVLDSEENDTSVEYGEQPMSLTFPSDLALHRRGQGLSELEEDDDEDDGLDSRGREETRRFESSSRAQTKRRQYLDDSPTTRISERNQRRTTAISHRENTHQRQSPYTTDFSKIDDENAAAMLSIASDRSSPPMFDSEDYVTLYRSAKTPVKQGSTAILPQRSLPHTPKSTSRNIQQDVSAVDGPDQGRVFVPETPLELQGITPKKENQILTQSPLKPASTHLNAVQQTSIPGGDLRNPARETTANDMESALHQDTQSQSSGGADESDKENKAPQVQIQVHEIHSNSDLEVYDKEDSFVEEGICQERSGEINHSNGLQRQGQLRAQQAVADVPEERIYNFTERRKDKRKQMHGHDCACCRRFYELTGPLPLPDGYNAFFTPAPRPGEKEVWEKSAEEKLQDRIQQISRHRVQHEQPLTPPGFWDTDFPSTQERLEWDKIATERRERKKQRMEQQLQKQQLQQQKRRRQ